MRTALYRHFDASGRLLYVGISLHSIQRTAKHRSGSHWFQDIARIEIEWLSERRSALAAEATAISKEKPLWNVARPKGCERAMDAPATEHVGRPGWAIFDRASGAADGWYSNEEEAQEMLQYWREEFPARSFRLVGLRGKHCFPLTNWLADVCDAWSANKEAPASA